MFVCALALTQGRALAQSFNGSTLNYQYYYPTNSSPFATPSNGPILVGSGIEIADVSGGGWASLNVSGANIFVNYYAGPTSWTAALFNGWVLSDQSNNLANISGVTVNSATNMAGFSSSNILFTADTISVNWQGLSFDAGTIVSLDVAFESAVSAVPEPSTWAMMLVGFGFVGCGMRAAKRRKKLTVSCA